MLIDTGMDDVLPKPFTRKSLLEMLERHLLHLKTIPHGMDPQSATAVPMAAQTSAAHSVKEDSSPAPSPAGSMSNWQSPGQFNGMPATVPSNMPQVQGQYVPATPAPAYAMDGNGVQYSAQPVAMNPGAAAARPPNRRQASDMSGTPDSANMAKRQRMYANQPQTMVNGGPGRTG